MNGEEKRFFETEFIKLKTQFSERWKNHETRSDDFKNLLKETFETINYKIESLCNASKEVSGRVMKLPCDLHKQAFDSIKNELEGIKNNDLKHLNTKINALLFTVLASVLAIIIIVGVKALLSTNGGG